MLVATALIEGQSPREQSRGASRATRRPSSSSTSSRPDRRVRANARRHPSAGHLDKNAIAARPHREDRRQAGGEAPVPSGRWAVEAIAASPMLRRRRPGRASSPGKWWPADYRGRTSSRSTRRWPFGLGIGDDTITVNVLGATSERPSPRCGASGRRSINVFRLLAGPARQGAAAPR